MSGSSSSSSSSQQLPIYATLNLPTATSHVSPYCVQWNPDGQLCFVSKAAVYVMTPEHGINFDTESMIKASPLGRKEKESSNSSTSNATVQATPTIGFFRTMIQFDLENAVTTFSNNKKTGDDDDDGDYDGGSGPTATTTGAVMKWPEHVQEWGAISLGSLDVTLVQVIFSPSGLSPEAGCIAATLSSNMDLALWMAVKNCVKGEWKKITDVTPLLLSHFLESDNHQEPRTPKITHVLCSQIICIAWTSQPNFTYQPLPLTNGSLLILGTRAGTATFLRYIPQSQSQPPISILSTIQLSTNWITHLAVSPWKAVSPGLCECYLSYATSSGTIGHVTITQNLVILPPSPPPASSSPSSNPYDIILQTHPHPTPLYVPPIPGAGITALKWITHLSQSTSSYVLVHCTPGQVHLHYPASSLLPQSQPDDHPPLVGDVDADADADADAEADPDAEGDEDNENQSHKKGQPGVAEAAQTHTHTRTLTLSTHRTSASSSSLHPAVGIAYLPARDALLVTLADGSVHVVCGVAGREPKVIVDSAKDRKGKQREGAPPEGGGGGGGWDRELNSAMLSRNLRNVFVRCEKGDVDRRDMCWVTGMGVYGGEGWEGKKQQKKRCNEEVFVWSYEVRRPGDFSYKHDARQRSVLVVAALWGEDDGDEEGGEGEKEVGGEEKIVWEVERVLAGVKAIDVVAGMPISVVRNVLFSLGQRVKVDDGVMERVVKVVGGLEGCESGLPNVVVGPFVLGEGGEAEVRKAFRRSLEEHLYGWDVVANWRVRLGVADHIWKLVRGDTQVRCGEVAQGLLDLIMCHVYAVLARHVRRVVDVGLVTGEDVPFVRRLGQVVRSGVAPPELKVEVEELVGLVVGNGEKEEQERCPACGSVIGLEDMRGAKCGNGHVWDRCSVTTFVLATAGVRTCVGCCRKAFLGGSEGGGWVVKEVLEATRRCVVCANAFVRIV